MIGGREVRIPPCFNPTLVRLRRISSRTARRGSRCFNPTLVRLRLGSPDGWRRWFRWFQSHAGSIEAWGKVACEPCGENCFNPTLVRLRRGKTVHYREAVKTRFQSHAGSIEALIKQAILIEMNKFQSHAGSIEAVDQGVVCGLRQMVSIPRWFD